MNIIIHKKPITKDRLKLIYDTCNKIFKDDKYFYTKEQIKLLKNDKNNVWL